jgi:hypothetical protein
MEAQHRQLSIAVLVFCAGHAAAGAVAPGDTCTTAVRSPASTASCLSTEAVYPTIAC